MKILFTLSLLLLLSACTSDEADEAEKSNMTSRWYSAEDANQGQTIFSQNCASCHGDKAQGIVKDWQKTQADGSYPAPPLNGSAHAWHHPMKILNRTIVNGGIPLGGTMPGFSEELTQVQRLQSIAYFQSFWTDEIYQIWLDRGGLK